ncbi:MAG TPA: PIN domain-containing protein [Verrucomicrobiae bacterium]
MSARFFLDTNVLVYCFDETAPRKQRVAHALVREALEAHHGIISTQVIQEFFSVASRKFARPMDAAACRVYLDSVLSPLCEVYPNVELYRQAINVREETGYTFYDSLIVAAALEAGCKAIYSEDLQHNRKLHGLEIKNPF